VGDEAQSRPDTRRTQIERKRVALSTKKMGDETTVTGPTVGAAKVQNLAILKLRQLLLVVLAVSIVCFTIGVFVLVQRIFDTFGPGVKQDLQWKTLRGARELARSADLGLAVHDTHLVEQSFGDYQKSEDVAAIVAQDAEGKVVATYRTPPPGISPFAGPAMTLHETENHLSTWAPAMIESDAVGRVAVVISKRRLVQSERMLHRISLANGVAGGVALLFGVLFVVLFTRAIAQRDAQLAEYASDLEVRIGERTAELDHMNRGMRLVLDNVEQGFVTISLDGVMSTERSAVVDRWLTEASATTLMEAIHRHDAEAAEWLDLGLAGIRDGALPLALLLDQLPKRMSLGARTLRLDYTPIQGDQRVSQLLVILTDVTDEIVRERVERETREMIQVFRRIGGDRVGFEQFYYEATALVAQIVAGGNAREIEARLIHTLKGNAGLYGLESIAQLCHQLESTVSAEERTINARERQGLRDEWTRVGEMVGALLVAGRPTIALDESDVKNLLEAIRNGAPAAELSTLIAAWRDEPASVRLGRLAEQARYLCRRLGKPEVLVHVDAGSVRLNPKRWSSFWAAMVHAVANAIDHGIEDPRTRLTRNKPERGQVWLTARRDARELVISIRDDGGGIDWTRLAERALARGLPHETREALIAALLTDGVSTREVAQETSGRGVGMAALLQATNRLGGTIEVQSEPGQETEFTFRFDPNAGASAGPPDPFGATQELVAFAPDRFRT
jgi:HPt (histidine-containing phosphotransfer) domain-containing protein